MSGDHDSSSPLVVEPTDDARSSQHWLGGDNTFAFIQRMPTTKTIDRVTLGDLGLGEGCGGGLRVQLFIREHPEGMIGYADSTQITYSEGYESLPAQPGRVTWSIPPTTLQEGKGYSFLLSDDLGGCRTATRVTWRHDGEVNAGPASCAEGPRVDANHGTPAMKRMWHVKDQEDGSTACVYTSSSEYYFHPSMPTGWLVTEPSWYGPGGIVRVGQRYREAPSAVDICGHGPANAGARVVFWRDSVGLPPDPYWEGYKDWVCMWPTPQFAPPGVTVAGGWQYGLRWLKELQGAPRDTYLRLDTVASQSAARFRPKLFFDSGEKWRPLDAERFLAEGGHQRCTNGVLGGIGGSCTPLFGWTDLRQQSDGYIDVRGSDPNATSGPASYASPRRWTDCVPPPDRSVVLDCDSNEDSTMYWHAHEPPGDYTYLGYWLLYRYNQSSQLLSSHEGDWEGVTVATPKSDPSRFHFAAFDAHGRTWRYLRDVLYCDGQEVAGSCGTEGQPSSARRVHTYVARGSHASYPRPCASDCWQTSAGGQDPLFGEDNFDGQRPWGRDADESALLAFPSALGWSNPEVANWVDWPGKWGPDDKPGSPGVQDRFRRPQDSNVVTCTERYTNPDMNDCSRLAASQLGKKGLPYVATLGLPLVAAALSPPPAKPVDDPCAAWSGPFVKAAVCDPREVQRSLAEGELGSEGLFSVDRPDRGDASGSAPGLAQLVGKPLEEGASVTLRGSVSAGSRLLVRARKGSEVFESRFSNVSLPSGGRIVVRRRREDGAPVAEIASSQGQRIAATEVERRRPAPREGGPTR